MEMEMVKINSNQFIILLLSFKHIEPEFQSVN